MKTKINPTSGPWTRNGTSIHHLDFDEPLDHRNEIASVPNENPESIANANLIAAAPDLLEALKSLLSIEENRFSDLVGNPKFPKFTARIEHARAAIAKAEGE